MHSIHPDLYHTSGSKMYDIDPHDPYPLYVHIIYNIIVLCTTNNCYIIQIVIVFEFPETLSNWLVVHVPKH